MTVRSLFAYLFFALLPGFAFAQAPAAAHSRVDIALDYNYVHSNAPPGGCGCFSMNGGNASAAWFVGPHVALVADIGSVYTNKASSSGLDLTLTNYLFGARVPYRIRKSRFEVFGQGLIGASHAGGTLAPTNAGGGVIAVSAGGGVDFKLSHHFAIRAAEVDYLLTTFPNGAGNTQNNTRAGAGIVFRFYPGSH
jgi:outer membrane immunogenic protein